MERVKKFCPLAFRDRLNVSEPPSWLNAVMVAVPLADAFKLKTASSNLCSERLA